MNDQFAKLNEQAERQRNKDAELWRKFKAALDGGEMSVMVEINEDCDITVTSSEQLENVLYRA